MGVIDLLFTAEYQKKKIPIVSAAKIFSVDSRFCDITVMRIFAGVLEFVIYAVLVILKITVLK